MSNIEPCLHKKLRKIDSFGEVSLHVCNNCKFIISDKYRKGFNNRKVYKNYYKNEVFGRFLFGIEYIIRIFRFIRAFRVFTISPHAKKVLDIGSGRGFMLHYLKKIYGYSRTAGTQIEENAYEFSKKNLGLEIYNKDLLKTHLQRNSFDLVTIWHVLEHVPYPERYILKIKQILKSSGLLIIEVPNFSSWTRSLTEKYWLGLDLKYHLHFFTPHSLTILLNKYGFKIKKIHTFSLEYSAFTSAQSIISFLTRTDHLFFNWIQNGKFSKKIIFHILLFFIFFPLCLLINLILYFSNRGEILLVVAENSK